MEKNIKPTHNSLTVGYGCGLSSSLQPAWCNVLKKGSRCAKPSKRESTGVRERGLCRVLELIEMTPSDYSTCAMIYLFTNFTLL